MGEVFVDGLEDLTSNPGRVILLKWYLIIPCLIESIIRNRSKGN